MKLDFSEDDKKKLLNDIFTGHVNPMRLPIKLYFATATLLMSAVAKGYSLKGKKYEALRDNVYMFSAAKTFQQVSQIASYLTHQKEKHEIKNSSVQTPLKDFLEKANETFDEYNDDWMESEYKTANAIAQSIRQWQNIEDKKDVFPYVKYNTFETVCEICSPYADLIFRIDDPALDTCSPPNHFNCYCYLDQIDDDTAKDEGIDSEKTIDEAVSKSEPNMNEMFKRNFGTGDVIFPKDHPYFNVDSKYRNFAKNNFQLPIPKA